jgi:hypothetical protein
MAAGVRSLPLEAKLLQHAIHKMQLGTAQRMQVEDDQAILYETAAEETNLWVASSISSIVRPGSVCAA